MENILQIKHFSFAYPEQKRLTLTDIDLSVGRGEFLRSEERRVGKEC